MGIILIHRVITYIPTYSGILYENLTVTNAILAFMIIILSLQTKLGLKVNILYERLLDLWNGNMENYESPPPSGKKVKSHSGSQGFTQSQAEHYENMQPDVFPPVGNIPMSSSPPTAVPTTSPQRGGRGGNQEPVYSPPEVVPANFAVGSLFGSSF